MALNAHLRLVGSKTGQIKGSVRQRGREDTIAVIAVSHDVVSPHDAASGQASGKRQHAPFVITKQLDRSSPLLHRTQATNEAFDEWELQFFTPGSAGGSGAGVEKQHFTIRLTSSVATRMPNTKHPELTRLETFEEVGFAYKSIEWTWVEGGITAVDEWAGRDA